MYPQSRLAVGAVLVRPNVRGGGRWVFFISSPQALRMPPGRTFSRFTTLRAAVPPPIRMNQKTTGIL